MTSTIVPYFVLLLLTCSQGFKVNVASDDDVKGPPPTEIVLDDSPASDDDGSGFPPTEIVLDDSPASDDDVKCPPSAEIVLDDSPVEILRNVRLADLTDDDLYQGDMILSNEQRQALLARKAIDDERYRWPTSADGMVDIDYRFDDDIVDQAGVKAGIAVWEEATCVRFHEVSAAPDEPHLIFNTHDTQCSSNVGHLYFRNGQNINLMPNCFNGGTDTVVHEIGHALGLYHEQSRTDRDDYLTIMFDNVQSGKEHNFDKETTNNYGLPYDYSSVMQYSPKAFAIDSSLYTIVAKDPLAQPLLVNSDGLSLMDKKIVNLMYNCIDTWLAACDLASDPCLNQGYTKQDCTCECPAGTEGSTCEILVKPYIDALIEAMAPGSGRITSEGTVTSPGYPAPITTASEVVQSIVAPECSVVKLTIDVFDLFGQTNLIGSQGSFQACWYTILEIKLDDPPITGTDYCDGDITAPRTFVSHGQNMVLTYKTRDYASSTKTGYSATVEFVPEPTGTCVPSTTTTGEPTTTEEITTTEESITTTTEEPTTTMTEEPTTTMTEEPTTTMTEEPTTTMTEEPTTTTTEEPTTTTTEEPTLITTEEPPTTISPETIIPSLSNGMCSLVSTANPSIFIYRSPDFPSNYKKSTRCTIWFNTTRPRYLRVTPVQLNLGPNDVIDLYSPYKTTTELDASSVRTAITLATASSRLRFEADSSSPGGRFVIRLEVVNTGCHELLELDVGSTGTLTIPTGYPAGTICEWWLRAPPGRQVEVSFSRFFIGGSTCRRDSVLISKTGDNKYLASTSQHCGGNRYSPGVVTSSDNALNILVNGQWGGYKGLTATYSVV